MRESRRDFIRKLAAGGGVLGSIGTVTARGSEIPEWNPNRVYRNGDKVAHAGYVWQARWYNKRKEPADTVAVWNRIGQLDGTEGYPDWTPDGIYRQGTRVTHDGAVWEARWWTEGDEPSTDALGPWAHIGETDGTRGGNETADSDSENTDDIETEDVDTAETPVERHGQLGVQGTDLIDAEGNPVQLRGMSTHGIQWFGWDDCVTGNSLDTLATDWQADLCRVAMYVQSDGYESDPKGFTQEVNRIVEEVTNRGMYALIDFHVLNPGNPMDNFDNAKQFFDDVAREHAEKDNVIYEICNEPNGVDWGTIRSYAHGVIPVIRAHDSVSPIVVGTRGWSSLGLAETGADGPQEIIDNPVHGENILYAYHFYAASHGQWERDALDRAADDIPIFVTECGSMEYTGDGPSDFESTRAFMDVMADNNISWAFWSYSDDWRTSGIWQEGASDADSWTVDDLTETGEWIRKQLRNN